MRELVRHALDDLRRSGDRIGVDGCTTELGRLGAEIVRLARVATSIHLAESARSESAASPTADLRSSARELAR